ncbi:MAG: GspH/FimT family pseudopilin [Sedimentisphaerales bacterium]|nr:GspH/FimT family pseudopilin [Sedimentisphaerales bacterium]
MDTRSLQRRRSQCPRGFTLVEVLLVVALIVVLGGLGGGMYAGTHRKLLVTKAARQFLLTAKYARIMAIERGRPYEVQLDMGNKGFLAATTQWNPNLGQMEKVPVRDYYCKPVAFEGQVHFEDIKIGAASAEAAADEESQQRIVFLPNGSADTAVVQIGDGKTHYSIAIVASTGKASLHEGTAGEVAIPIVDLDAQ